MDREDVPGDLRAERADDGERAEGEEQHERASGIEEVAGAAMRVDGPAVEECMDGGCEGRGVVTLRTVDDGDEVRREREDRDGPGRSQRDPRHGPIVGAVSRTFNRALVVRPWSPGR